MEIHFYWLCFYSQPKTKCSFSILHLRCHLPILWDAFLWRAQMWIVCLKAGCLVYVVRDWILWFCRDQKNFTRMRFVWMNYLKNVIYLMEKSVCMTFVQCHHDSNKHPNHFSRSWYIFHQQPLRQTHYHFSWNVHTKWNEMKRLKI